MSNLLVHIAGILVSPLQATCCLSCIYQQFAWLVWCSNDHWCIDRSRCPLFFLSLAYCRLPGRFFRSIMKSMTYSLPCATVCLFSIDFSFFFSFLFLAPFAWVDANIHEASIGIIAAECPRASDRWKWKRDRDALVEYILLGPMPFFPVFFCHHISPRRKNWIRCRLWGYFRRHWTCVATAYYHCRWSWCSLIHFRRN